MALTLPYPSMNFVPLDVLTAAEQNQLVANIEYIANQFPITNANIASSTVKSSNIDWTSMDYAKIYIGGPTQNGTVPMVLSQGTTVTVSNNSFRASVTGVYLVTFIISATNSTNQTVSFKSNGTELSAINLRDAYQATTATLILSLSTTDVCTLEVVGGSNFSVYGYSWLNVVRIA